MTSAKHPYWYRVNIAEHEVVHVFGAKVMGLKVAWVSIEQVDGVEDIHLAATGIEIDGEDEADNMRLALDAKIPADQLLAVCVTMGMPSYISSTGYPDGWLYRYSTLELRQALDMAEEGGLDRDEVMYQIQKAADEIHDNRWDEFCALVQRVVEEGRVEFVMSDA